MSSASSRSGCFRVTGSPICASKKLRAAITVGTMPPGSDPFRRFSTVAIHCALRAFLASLALELRRISTICATVRVPMGFAVISSWIWSWWFFQ